MAFSIIKSLYLNEKVYLFLIIPINDKKKVIVKYKLLK